MPGQTYIPGTPGAKLREKIAKPNKTPKERQEAAKSRLVKSAVAVTGALVIKHIEKKQRERQQQKKNKPQREKPRINRDSKTNNNSNQSSSRGSRR